MELKGYKDMDFEDSSFEAAKMSLSQPDNVKPGEENLYAMVLHGEIRACRVQKHQGVYANRELVLWKGGAMLEESFAWPWLKDKHYGSLKEQLKFWFKNSLRPTVIVHYPVLWCLDGYVTGGYFHWITDVLPRLWMAKACLPGAYFALPDYFLSKWPFIQDLLSLLDIPKTLRLVNNRKYKLEKLILPTRAGNPFFLQPVPVQGGVWWLKQKALASSNLDLGKRIYISRNKAGYRKVLNEAELLPVLVKYGFRVLCLEDYKLADQISICNNADVMLGLHGAGLSNLVFMQPRSKLIEIRPNRVYNMYTCFFTLSSNFDISYNYLLCNYGPNKLPGEKRIDDQSVIVAPEILDRELAFVLNRQ
jgi:hypothetical protein